MHESVLNKEGKTSKVTLPTPDSMFMGSIFPFDGAEMKVTRYINPFHMKKLPCNALASACIIQPKTRVTEWYDR